MKGQRSFYRRLSLVAAADIFQECDAHGLRGVVEASAEVSLLRSQLRRTSRAEEIVLSLSHTRTPNSGEDEIQFS